MELTRSNIVKFLDDGYSQTQYCKKFKNVNVIKDFDNISLLDLDYIEVLEKFASLLKNAFNSLPYVKDWKPSGRQQFVTISLNQRIGDLIDGRFKDKKNLLVRLYEDCFWDVYDYFYDYGNPDPVVNKLEVESMLAVMENFLLDNKNQNW